MQKIVDCFMLEQLFRSSAIKKIFRCFSDNNIRLVGGCVRDLIINKQVNDIDFAVDCVPENTIKILSDHKIKYLLHGMKHGTVTAIINKTTYEITTLRRDVITDGRHAEVAWTNNWQEDASRRDFTINAMYIDDNGYLYDYFNGINHLRDGKIIFVGDPVLRIQEDYLRILRFFRFFASYGNNIDQDVLLTIAKLSSGLQKISYERIRTEVEKILLTNNAPLVLRYMNEYKVLEQIFEADSAINFIALTNVIKIEHNNNIAPCFIRRMLAFLPQELIKKVLAKWKFANSEKKLIKLLSKQFNFEDYCINNNSIDLNYYTILTEIDLFGKEVLLSRVIISIALLKDINYTNVTSLIKKIQSAYLPDFPVNGIDIINQFHITGKPVGVILDKLRDIWIKSNCQYDKNNLLKIGGNFISND